MVLNATIDPITRLIEYDVTPFSCMTDHAVTGISFRCPNNIGISNELIDMTVSVRYSNGRKELFTYHVVDKTVDNDDIIFMWVLDEPATRYDGVLTYNVCAEYISGNTIKRWNTQISSIEVFRTLEVGDNEPTTEQVEEFDRLLADLSDVISGYQTMNVVAETLTEGSSATANWNNGTLTLGIPRGDSGPTELPDMPTTDGFYVLTATVSNGVSTLAWVAQ